VEWALQWVLILALGLAVGLATMRFMEGVELAARERWQPDL